MYSTDPVADMLTRIRNAIMVQKHQVDIPYSRLKEQIAGILKTNKFIDKVEIDGKGVEKVITLTLNDKYESSRITEIKRVSKPGRRVYKSSTEIPKLKNGRGIVVMSTSKGIMTGDEAYRSKVGGEVLCSVY